MAMLYAVSAADGKQLWEFNTAREFETVNKVAPTAARSRRQARSSSGGMVFVGSGYAISSGALGGNVLLAFGID